MRLNLSMGPWMLDASDIHGNLLEIDDYVFANQRKNELFQVRLLKWMMRLWRNGFSEMSIRWTAKLLNVLHCTVTCIRGTIKFRHSSHNFRGTITTVTFGDPLETSLRNRLIARINLTELQILNFLSLSRKFQFAKLSKWTVSGRKYYRPCTVKVALLIPLI